MKTMVTRAKKKPFLFMQNLLDIVWFYEPNVSPAIA
jgi:hypothetical protein